MKKEMLIIFLGVLLIGVASAEVNMTEFFPNSVKLGDVQLNIRIANLGNDTLNDVYALVTGNGFSSYNVIPADSILGGEKGYIFVFGNLKYSGNTTIDIKILGQNFYQNISVIDTAATQVLEDELKKQQEKSDLIQNLSVQVSALETEYDSLANLLDTKQSDDYDVSKVNLNDLKGYIRAAQANLFAGDPETAQVNLKLALDEYNFQKNLLDNAKKISFAQRLKNNALLFSTLAGSILAFFAIYELVLKKGSYLAEKVVRRDKKK